MNSATTPRRALLRRSEDDRRQKSSQVISAGPPGSMKGSSPVWGLRVSMVGSMMRALPPRPADAGQS